MHKMIVILMVVCLAACQANANTPVPTTTIAPTATAIPTSAATATPVGPIPTPSVDMPEGWIAEPTPKPKTLPGISVNMVK